MPRPPAEYLRCIPPRGFQPPCIVVMVCRSLLVFQPVTVGTNRRSLQPYGRFGLVRWSTCGVYRPANALRRPSAFAPSILALVGLRSFHVRESARAFSVCSCSRSPHLVSPRLWFLLLLFLVYVSLWDSAPTAARTKFRISEIRNCFTSWLLERCILGKSYYLLHRSFF